MKYKDSFHHWIHDCRWEQLYSDWAEKRVYPSEIIFRQIYVVSSRESGLTQSTKKLLAHVIFVNTR